MYDDTIVTVESIEIEHLTEAINVYNFEVENAHTYYVTNKGILVHNLCAEGKALAEARKNGIEVESYMGHIDDFSDDALDYLGKVKHRSNGTTISDHVSGTKIHYGFKGNGQNISPKLRVDGLENGILYELKPFSARNIRKAVNQLVKYKLKLESQGKTILKMILVLY